MQISNNIKSIIYGIIAILIAVGAFYALSEYRKSHQPPKELSLREILQLNEQDRIKELEKRLGKLSEEVQNLASTATASAKYNTYIQLAEAQIELGKFTEALDSLNKIPEERRSNSKVAAAYVRAYKGSGDTAKAKELSIKNVVDYEMESGIWLAHIEANSDLPPDQINLIYKMAITKTQSNLDVMISYAKFSEKIGDKATAIAAWETARNVDPSNAGKYEAEIARLR